MQRKSLGKKNKKNIVTSYVSIFIILLTVWLQVNI